WGPVWAVAPTDSVPRNNFPGFLLVVKRRGRSAAAFAPFGRSAQLASLHRCARPNSMVPYMNGRRSNAGSRPAGFGRVACNFSFREVRYAELQHPADGRVVWLATGLEAAVRRPFHSSGLPAGGSRPDQRRRLLSPIADTRPQGPGAAGIAQAARQGDGRSGNR